MDGRTSSFRGVAKNCPILLRSRQRIQPAGRDPNAVCGGITLVFQTPLQKLTCAHLKASRHCASAARLLPFVAHPPPQPAHILHGRVGQDGVIQVVPQGLDGIECGGVGRRPLHAPPVTVLANCPLGGRTAVGRQPNQQQDHGASPLSPQGIPKAHHLRAPPTACLQNQQPA
jgi:hypothetical protein